MGITHSIKRCIGFAIVMAISFVYARPVSAIEYQVSYPQEISNRIFLAPGAVGSFSFDVENRDAIAGTATVRLLNALNGGFNLEVAQPGSCGAPVLTATSIFIPVELAAAEFQRCSYRLTRSPASTRDGVLGLCSGIRSDASACAWEDPAVRLIYAGFLPELAISTEQTTPTLPGDVESIVKVTVKSASTLGTRDIHAYSQCLPFNERNPYSLDNQIPGGCPIVQQQLGCELSGFGIPPPIYRWVVRVSALAPKGEASCMVRMRFPNPLASSFADTLTIESDRFQRFTMIPLDLGNNYFGIDPNPANDEAPFGVIVPPVAVPVGDHVTWIVLCGILVGIAWRRRTPGKNQV